MITCIHKHYTVDEWVAWASTHESVLPYIAVSSGISEEDFNKTSEVLSKVNVNFICLDVANGYSEHVSRNQIPNSPILI